MKPIATAILLLSLFAGPAYAERPCTNTEALAIWDTTHIRLQQLFGLAVEAPRIAVYRNTRELPRNVNGHALAYYASADKTLHVSCQDGDTPVLEVTVRHEATHHYLSEAFGSLPQWLDEGLASYMETGTLDERDGADHLNESRLNEFVDMLKWSKVPPLQALLTRHPSPSNLSQFYAAYWGLAFALMHHADHAVQTSRRHLLRELLAHNHDGPTAVNQRLLSGVLREQASLPQWERLWRRQIWELR